MAKKSDLLVYNEKALVREANEFVEASYKLNVWEDRIFLMTLAQIKPSDEDFKQYKIYIRDFVVDYGIKDNDIYARIKEAAKSLRKREITIPQRYGETDGWLTTGLINSYGGANDDVLSYVVIELHPKLKPYLLQLKERFTQYNISFLMKMQSSHSKRIYKLLKQYEKIGRRKFTIQKLRDLLCVAEGEYPKYYDFKRRFILKAQQDLLKYTDLAFTFEEEKKGRSVTAIIFNIISNVPKMARTKESEPRGSVPQSVTPKLSESQEELFEVVKDWGISEDFLIKSLKERSEAHIRACMEVTLEQGEKVENKANYFVSLLQKETVQSPIVLKKRQIAVQKEQKLKQAEAEKRIKKALQALKNEKYQKQQSIIAQLLQDVDFAKIVEQQARTKRSSKYNKTLSFEENYAKNRMFKIHVDNLVISLKEAYFSHLDIQFAQKEKELKEKLRS